MLIIHANIHTMRDRRVIADGFLRIEGTKIAEIGEMAALGEIPADALDLGGAACYPGFIDAHTHLGMWEDGLGFEGDDGNEDTDPATPHLRAIDAVNPMDRCFAEALDAGVTTVMTGPGSANPIAGQMAALKTHGVRVDDMVVRAPAGIKFALGENPKTTYHEKNQGPVTRMATAAIIREQLFKAQRYQAQQTENAYDAEIDPPDYDIKCEALLPLLQRKIKAHFHAHRLDDIFTAVRIAQEFELDYTIIHGTQGYRAAGELAQAGVTVLSGPLICDRSKPELRDLTPAAPAALAQAGVRLAIITDHPVVPVQYLPVCAALAVREGLDPDTALEAITVSAAEICGIADRVGTLESGKDADLVVFDTPPLSLESRPRMVFINGKQVRG